ncbi:MAG TPA: 16S rRNA (cytosine(1402)-N(4))-methyltransferase RsmH [Leptospiraceae bacterium]|nr:16S rRNA (cytosine(1402)-N(4))-methyltransferase RsmH [Leptospiraceae bacterium]HMW05654.1 16S rRNA (cytosine(1402)-N(4))-methyltransferase RsmH [Leptospiraceae bacterium]HMX34366.1 16S rRNA (cytosine(1402)-N(4))-methyltransferase RsmH [Leptospiraceae bacterium]HMY30313.1 16S rRNA (cytosine(1402)-N(4))-methyltransferase RsmH [Leptospiraceae bacterium]HMZ63666.1 16S rRNA (cytosine(1402)-N(4))-methyltransferase RsmH [Leptospiraceae bacterium]
MTDFQLTHVSVMPEEIISYFTELGRENEIRFIDGTAGEGGHTQILLEHFPNSKVLLNDRDSIMLERASERLKKYLDRVFLREGNFSEILSKDIEEAFQTQKVNGILLDLGISTFHLIGRERGFSFKTNENLDMRLDESGRLTAFDVVNKYKAEKLSQIFREYGEENWTKKIVEKIVLVRRKKPIQTTQELAKIVESVIPRKFWPDKTHPSFRIFQAIRIEVNDELGHIKKGLEALLNLLDKDGIFCVISFHSLEDRIVKQVFREKSKDGKFEILTKKPILPKEEEIKQNPSSRSAKLRVIKAL